MTILLREMGLFNVLLQSAIFCLVFIKFSLGSLHFLRGRPRGGMLLAPSFPSGVNVKLPEAQWFTQRLDHFDDSNIRTWQQRYFYNDSFHLKPDGPVFLMIGGEGEANPIWLTVGDMMKNAKVFGAFALLLEHRFYGQSRPTRYVKRLPHQHVFKFSIQCNIGITNYQHGYPPHVPHPLPSPSVGTREEDARHADSRLFTCCSLMGFLKVLQSFEKCLMSILFCTSFKEVANDSTSLAVSHKSLVKFVTPYQSLLCCLTLTCMFTASTTENTCDSEPN